MPSRPVVSCLIPAYNHERYVAEAVESVLAGPSDIEVVVVDDASTDATYERLLPYADRVTLLRNPANVGHVRTLQRAYEAAHGDYLTLLASDDRWLPDRMPSQLDEMTRTGAEWSFGQAYVIDGAGHRISAVAQGPAPDSGPAGALRTLLAGQGVYAPTLLFRRELLERAGGLQDLFLEDLAITLRFAALAEPLFLSRPLVDYRMHEGQMHLAMVQSRSHLSSHAAAVQHLASWPGLPAVHRSMVDEHVAAWAYLAGVAGGEGGAAPTGAATNAVVVRQAPELGRDLTRSQMRQLRQELRASGHREAAAAVRSATPPSRLRGASRGLARRLRQ
ncbi:MAG: hypothetical protein JWP11_1154 [Frankiales bacterium]|nr:hypothetical protein [Frankiales bacterium]